MLETRFCLLLKYSGYKYNEIADILEIKKTSIKPDAFSCSGKIHRNIKGGATIVKCPAKKYTDRIYR